MAHKKIAEYSTDVATAEVMPTVSRAARVLQIVATDNTFRTSKRPIDPAEPKRGSIVTFVGNCIHCGARLAVTESGETDATIEHIMPRAAGGSDDDLWNLALACSRCNNEKGIRHDGRKLDERAKEVIGNLKQRRVQRWRPPNTKLT